MINPIIKKLLENGDMVNSSGIITTVFELELLLDRALKSKKIKVLYHFEVNEGKLIFDKVLGKDANYEFYNTENGNLEARKEEAKRVIVNVLVDRFNESNTTKLYTR